LRWSARIRDPSATALDAIGDPGVTAWPKANPVPQNEHATVIIDTKEALPGLAGRVRTFKEASNEDSSCHLQIHFSPTLPPGTYSVVYGGDYADSGQYRQAVLGQARRMAARGRTA